MNRLAFHIGTLILAIVASPCIAAVDESSAVEIAPADLPPALAAAVEARLAGFRITEATRKQRDGRVYYDVEGERADGVAAELDLLQKGDVFEVVEVQRDVAWADVPAAVRDAAAAAPEPFVPVRVIESVQNDGSTIYELFAPGQPADPAREVRWHAGKAEVLDSRWMH